MEKNKIQEKSRLGRGLASLIPPSAKAPVIERTAAISVPSSSEKSAAAPTSSATGGGEAEASVRHLAIRKIIANTYQPRTEFDEAALRELTESVLVHGVLQPIMVRPRGNDRYELIAGERRFRAAQAAGLTQIPAVIREMTDEESLTVALIENIQREDLNAMEAARGYKQLLDQFGLTQAELSRQIGKSQSTIAYALSLLRLPLEMQESISSGKLSMEHGKVLLSVAALEKRISLWQMMLDEGISVVEARKRAQETPSPLPQPTPMVETYDDEPETDVHLQAIEDRLRSSLGLKVKIRTGRTGRGLVTIDFSNIDELETIIDRIVG